MPSYVTAESWSYSAYWTVARPELKSKIIMDFNEVHSAIAHGVAATNAGKKDIELATENVMNVFKKLNLEKTCLLSDSAIEYPLHKEDVLLCIQDMELPNSEKYVVGGYYDADINQYFPFVDDADRYEVLMWLPLPRAAKYWLE